ncbi:MAG: zf-HC2 domain-containing protein [Myxococcota bacterium]
MSCFPEASYALYTDGELEPGERRGVEMHLVGCQRCRALVLALREEAAALTDALFEREPVPLRTAPRPDPARGVALGIVPALAAVVVAAGVIGVILELRLPSGIEWLNPFRLVGVYEMAFNLVFLLRDEVPGLLELLLAAAALGSVAALAAFGLSVISKRWLGSTLSVAAALAVLLSASPSWALDLRFHAGDVTVPAGETLDETVIVNAETVQIDGVVDGDLIVLLAKRLTIRGEIRGNVFCSVRNLEVSGTIAGNLHVIGQNARLGGTVLGNVFSLSERFTLAEKGRIARDATHVAEGVSIDGSVGRDLFAAGEWLEVRGSVGRNVDTRVERVTLLAPARVGGDLDALFWREPEIEVAPGASIGGETRTRIHERPSRLDRFLHGHFYLWLGVRLAAATVVGLLLHALVPALFDGRLGTGGEFFRSLGIGFLAAVAAPIAVVVSACTLVGIPLALMGAAVFLTALYVAGIAVAALIGKSLLWRGGEVRAPFGLVLLAGLAVLMVGVSLPFVGPPLRVVAVLAGLGLLVERAQSAWRARVRGAPAPA